MLKKTDYIQHLEETFPYLFSMKKLNELKHLTDDISILEETSIEKSKLIEKIEQGIDECADLYQKFINLLHKNNHDFINSRFKEITDPQPDSYAKYHEINDLKINYSKLAIDYLTEKDRKLDDEMGPVQKFKGYNPDYYYKLLNHLYTYLYSLLNNILWSYNIFKREKDILEKGEIGEKYVEQELDLFKDKYKFLQNIVLPFSDLKGKTSETDLYVVTNKGILVCEIKNKGNEKYTFRIAKDGQWSKYNENGKFLEVIDSPFAQNTRHCIATEKILKENGVTDFKIIPVVIIANEEVHIDSDSENIVIRPSELYNLIEGLKYPEKYNEKYQEKVINILKSKSIKKENLFNVYFVRDDAEEKILHAATEIFETLTLFSNYYNDVRHDGYVTNLHNSHPGGKLFITTFLFSLLFNIFAGLRIANGHFSFFYIITFLLTIGSGYLLYIEYRTTT